MTEDPDTRWVPVTQLLEAASAALPVGSLIHGEAFSLFEAMSAVEVGNPKMDAAVMGTGPTVEELVAGGAAPVELDLPQLLGVLDKLAMMEATWQCGGPLAQTVYSCLYMLQLDRTTSNAPLHSYCKVLRSCCIAARCLVLQGAVVEEEDVAVITFGLPLSEVLGPEDEQGQALITKALDSCREALEGLARGEAQAESSAASSSGRAAPTPELYEALITRLQFRKEFFMAIQSILKHSHDDLELTVPARHVSRALQLLESINSTHHLADPDPPGFHEHVSKGLLSAAPIRQQKALSADEAWAHWGRILSQLQQALELRHVKNLHDLQQFVATFSSLRAAPVPRSAAHYLMLRSTWGVREAPPPKAPDTTKANGPAAPAPPAASSSGARPSWVPTREMVAQSCGFLNTQHHLGADIEMFLEQALIAFSNWCQAMLMNSCRQRRRLRRGLEDWGNLYQHAIIADTSADFEELTKREGWAWAPPRAGDEDADMQGPLGTWVEYHTTCCIMRHLLLGFELQLYQPHEYAMIYWYTANLASGVRSVRSSLFQVLPPPPTASSSSGSSSTQQQRGGKGGKGKKGAGAAAVVEDPAAAALQAQRQQQLTLDLVNVELSHHMCYALVRLMLALKLAGVVPPCSGPFNSEAQRFDQRFATFHHVVMRPPAWAYADFVSSTDVSAHNAADILALAVQSLQAVKGQVALIRASPHVAGVMTPGLAAELKAFERLALANQLACSVVARALADGTQLQVSYDFSHHPYYPALSLKTKVSSTPKAQ